LVTRFAILKSSDFDREAGNPAALRDEADILIVCPDELPEDFRAFVESQAADWLEGSPAVVFDAELFFRELQWQVPGTKQDHLGRLLLIDLAGSSTDELPGQWSDLQDLPTVQMDYETAWKMLHRFSDYYYQVGILTTDFCNLSCEMCMFHSRAEAAYEFNARRRTDRDRREIEPRAIGEFIRQIPQETAVLFSASGEALTLGPLSEYIRSAAELNKPPMLVTNGMLLTPEKSAELLGLGVVSFIISIDGHTAELYSRRRKGGCFETVLGNIAELVKLRGRGGFDARVSINSILFEEHEGLKDEILDFWSPRVDQLTFMSERTNYLGRPRSTFIEPPAGGRPCFALMEGPILLSNALIAPCCSIAIGEFFERMDWLEDIRTTDLADAVRTYREMMLDAGSPLREYCSRCHYWSSGYWRGGKSPFSEIHIFKKDRQENFKRKASRLLKRMIGTLYRRQ